MDLYTGEWVHRDYEDKDLKFNPTIGNILKISLKNCFDEDEIDKSKLYPKYLEEAKKLAQKLELDEIKSSYSSYDDYQAENLRWFYFVDDKK
jgi:hypothetical protein